MAGDHASELLYGHPGDVEYDESDKKWAFTRHFGHPRQIEPIGPYITVFQPSKTLEDGIRGAVQRSKGKDLLLKKYPELEPATYFPPSWAWLTNAEGDDFLKGTQTSEVIEVSASKYDPIKSDLFAIGRIVNSNRSGRKKSSVGARYPEVAAVAGGSGGETLRLNLLLKARLRWKSEEGTVIHSQTANGGEKGFWIGDRTPIQQVAFAEGSKYAQSWLAVRYYVNIYILRPVIRGKKTSQRIQSHSGYHLPASLLDGNHICTLTSGEAGDRPFSHVAFNPWNHHQIAVIDQNGSWSIWSIKSQSTSSGRWEMRKWSHGTLLDPEETASQPALTLEDGWGRVCWAGDSNILLISTRRSLKIINVRGSPRVISTPDIGLENSKDWILDVRRTAKHCERIFVLTSSRLFCFKISPLEASQEASGVDSAASMLLTLVHFRDPRDVSLTLSLVASNEKGGSNDQKMMVLLYSRTNSMTTSFTFFNTEKTNKTYSKYDPYMIPLHDHSNNHGNSPVCAGSPYPKIGVACLQMVPLRAKGPPSPSKRLDWEDAELEFYNLRILGNDMRFFERVYVSRKAGHPISFTEPVVIDRERSSKKSSRSSKGFIVPNGNRNGYAEALSQLQVRSLLHRREQSVDPLVEQDGTPIMNWLSKEISKLNQAVDKGNKGGSQIKFAPLDQYLELAHDAFSEESLEEQTGIKLLSELSSKETLAMDIDYGVTSFSQLREDIGQRLLFSSNDISETSPTMSESIPPFIVSDLGLGGGLDLDQIYESLVQSYLTCLPSGLPSRLRFTIEKQIRYVATQICLASHAIRKGRSGDEITLAEKPTFVIPVRRKASASDFRSRRSSTPRRETQDATTTLSQESSTQDTILMSSPGPSSPLKTSSSATTQLSQEIDDTADEDPNSQLVSAVTESSPKPHLPNDLSRILTHWTVGANPANYDYEATKARLDDEARDEAGESSRPKKKAKKTKKSSQEGESTAKTRQSKPPSSQISIGSSLPFSQTQASQQQQIPPTSPGHPTNKTSNQMETQESEDIQSTFNTQSLLPSSSNPYSTQLSTQSNSQAAPSQLDGAKKKAKKGRKAGF